MSDNEKNPFLGTYDAEESRSKVGVKKDEALVNLGTGEVTGYVEVGKFRKFDAEPFVKVYNIGLALWMGLGRTTGIVLGYVLLNLDYNKDYVLFNIKICADELGLSEMSVRRAIGELLNRRILAKSTIPSKYYVNINYFFRGDRLKYMKRNGAKRTN